VNSQEKGNQRADLRVDLGAEKVTASWLFGQIFKPAPFLLNRND
jgi:hypothetical protein